MEKIYAIKEVCTAVRTVYFKAESPEEATIRWTLCYDPEEVSDWEHLNNVRRIDIEECDEDDFDVR